MAVPWPQEGFHHALNPFDETLFEYAITEGPRKGEVFGPDGDGWMELDWQRGDFTDTVLWRRERRNT